MSPPPTPRRMNTTVARAVRHIKERIRYHNTQTSVAIGKHLFQEVYGGQRKLLRRGGNDWTRRCITRIAADPRVDVDDDVLLMCIHCYLLVRKHGRHARNLPLPAISNWKWERLWQLEGDPDALVAVAAWVEKKNVPHRLLATAAGLVTPFLREGGNLEDLLVCSLPRAYVVRRMDRLMGVVERVYKCQGISPKVRRRTLEILDELIESL